MINRRNVLQVLAGSAAIAALPLRALASLVRQQPAFDAKDIETVAYGEATPFEE